MQVEETIRISVTRVGDPHRRLTPHGGILNDPTTETQEDAHPRSLCEVRHLHQPPAVGFRRSVLQKSSLWAEGGADAETGARVRVSASDRRYRAATTQHHLVKAVVQRFLVSPAPYGMNNRVKIARVQELYVPNAGGALGPAEDCCGGRTQAFRAQLIRRPSRQLCRRRHHWPAAIHCEHRCSICTWQFAMQGENLLGGASVPNAQRARPQ
mmetsp:Transcript_15182/g.38372  ORF Transcript_15182/g.38372 Transcript_15182/m.38372 type:complete len:211 (-) Transcript_15182:604-1236(-)